MDHDLLRMRFPGIRHTWTKAVRSFWPVIVNAPWSLFDLIRNRFGDPVLQNQLAAAYLLGCSVTDTALVTCHRHDHVFWFTSIQPLVQQPVCLRGSP